MKPRRAAGREQPRKPFGWQGLSLTVPADWDIVYTRGDRRSGHLRLADSESLRLEARWQAGPAKEPASLAVDAYVRGLRKRARKDRVDLTVHRGLGIARPPGMEVECYRWRAREHVMAMLSRCNECGRTVHLQMPDPSGPVRKSLARTSSVPGKSAGTGSPCSSTTAES